MLQRCDNPPCPECGCQESKVLRRETRYGLSIERRMCGHCGHLWEERPSRWPTAEETVGGQSSEPPVPSPQPPRDDGAVVYHPVRCPECDSKETKVTSKPRIKGAEAAVRYHKCQQCGAAFKSVEE